MIYIVYNMALIIPLWGVVIRKYFILPGVTIDKLLSIDTIMLININQSMKIDTHNFSSQNQLIFINFIDKRKT